MRRYALPFLTAAAPTAAVALVLAGCGGSAHASPAASSGGYGVPATQAGASAAPARAATAGQAIRVARTPLGQIIVDGRGRTLYLFEKDKGTKSTCNGACASVWPPFTTTGKPRSAAGVSARKLGTTTRSGGKLEVTYGGHPLYYYIGDTKAGDTRGQGLDQFGAEWYVVGPNGQKVKGRR